MALYLDREYDNSSDDDYIPKRHFTRQSAKKGRLRNKEKLPAKPKKSKNNVKKSSHATALEISTKKLLNTNDEDYEKCEEIYGKYEENFCYKNFLNFKCALTHCSDKHVDLKQRHIAEKITNICEKTEKRQKKIEAEFEHYKKTKCYTSKSHKTLGYDPKAHRKIVDPRLASRVIEEDKFTYDLDKNKPGFSKQDPKIGAFLESDLIGEMFNDYIQHGIRRKKTTKPICASQNRNLLSLYLCETCNSHFMSLKTVHKHVKTCNGEVIQETCGHCKLLFESDEVLKHIIKHHIKRECKKFNIIKIVKVKEFDNSKVNSIYGFNTSNTENLTVKNVFHNKLKDAKLNITTDMNEATNLSISKKSKKVVLFKCQGCTAHFINKTDLIQHSKESFHDFAEIIKCPFCKLDFVRGMLSEHVKQHHSQLKLNKEDFSVVTDIDRIDKDETYYDNNALSITNRIIDKNHTVTNFEKDKQQNKLYECGICHKDFNSKFDLKMHIIEDDCDPKQSKEDSLKHNIKRNEKQVESNSEEKNQIVKNFKLSKVPENFEEKTDDNHDNLNFKALCKTFEEPSEVLLDTLIKCTHCSFSCITNIELQEHLFKNESCLKREFIKLQGMLNIRTKYGMFNYNSKADNIQLKNIREQDLQSVGSKKNYFKTNYELLKCECCGKFYIKKIPIDNSSHEELCSCKGKLKYISLMYSFVDLDKIEITEVSVIDKSHKNYETNEKLPVSVENLVTDEKESNKEQLSNKNDFVNEEAYSSTDSYDSETSIDETTNKIKLHKCKDCDVVYLNEQTCLDHIKRHKHLSPSCYSSCPYCGLKFLHRSLEIHRRIQHKNYFNLKDVTIVEYSPQNRVKRKYCAHELQNDDKNTNNKLNDNVSIPNEEERIDSVSLKNDNRITLADKLDSENSSNLTLNISKRGNLLTSVEKDCYNQPKKSNIRLLKCEKCKTLFFKNIAESLDSVNLCKKCITVYDFNNESKQACAANSIVSENVTITDRLRIEHSDTSKSLVNYDEKLSEDNNTNEPKIDKHNNEKSNIHSEIMSNLKYMSKMIENCYKGDSEVTDSDRTKVSKTLNLNEENQKQALENKAQQNEAKSTTSESWSSPENSDSTFESVYNESSNIVDQVENIGNNNNSLNNRKFKSNHNTDTGDLNVKENTINTIISINNTHTQNINGSQPMNNIGLKKIPEKRTDNRNDIETTVTKLKTKAPIMSVFDRSDEHTADVSKNVENISTKCPYISDDRQAKFSQLNKTSDSIIQNNTSDNQYDRSVREKSVDSSASASTVILENPRSKDDVCYDDLSADSNNDTDNLVIKAEKSTEAFTIDSDCEIIETDTDKKPPCSNIEVTSPIAKKPAKRKKLLVIEYENNEIKRVKFNEVIINLNRSSSCKTKDNIVYNQRDVIEVNDSDDEKPDLRINQNVILNKTKVVVESNSNLSTKSPNNIYNNNMSANDVKTEDDIKNIELIVNLPARSYATPKTETVSNENTYYRPINCKNKFEEEFNAFNSFKVIGKDNKSLKSNINSLINQKSCNYIPVNVKTEGNDVDNVIFIDDQ